MFCLICVPKFTSERKRACLRVCVSARMRMRVCTYLCEFERLCLLECLRVCVNFSCVKLIRSAGVSV